MPMIDIYAAAGLFRDTKKLAREAADTVRTVEQAPDLPMFRKNTAAFVHELPPSAISNIEGDDNYVRVQVTTNAGALDRAKQIEVVRRLTDLVAASAGDESLKQRAWVVLTEAAPGGWGLWGHAHTNEDLVAAARAQIAKARGGPA